MCVCEREARTLFWDPICLPYTPSLALQLPSPSPSHSPLPSDNSAEHISPSPNYASPPPPSPSLLLKLFQQKRRKREKVTNHAVSESLCPPCPLPSVCVCVCMNFCTCVVVNHLIYTCVCMFLMANLQLDEWACGTHISEKLCIFSFTGHMRSSVIVNDFYWFGTLI